MAEKINATHIVFLAAMDPAGIPFSNPYLIDENLRLSPDDAPRTVAVYSDKDFLGSSASFARINIRLNNGICQPECHCPLSPYTPIPTVNPLAGFFLSALYGTNATVYIQATYTCNGIDRNPAICSHFGAVRATMEAIRPGQTQNYPMTGPNGETVLFTPLATYPPSPGPVDYQLKTIAYYPYNWTSAVNPST